MSSYYSLAAANWRSMFSNFNYPAWLSADGLEIWNWSSPALKRSLDDGETWTTIRTFTGTINGVRVLASGELLVSEQNVGAPGKLWRSTGYTRATPTAATWSTVLTCSGNDNYIQGQWGMCTNSANVFISEYGSKVAPNNARYVYRSTDDGVTWSVIFDWQGTGRHVHGVAYDQWRNRVWVALGDTNQGIVYSDDWDQATPTWTTLSTTVQPVGIVPMEKAVLFSTDDATNGVLRWTPASGQLDVALSLDPTTGSLTHLGGLSYRRSTAHPVFISFSAVPGYTGKGYVVATNDGITLSIIWRDSAVLLAGGLSTIMGPTASGKLLGTLADGRRSSGARLVINSWNVP